MATYTSLMRNIPVALGRCALICAMLASQIAPSFAQDNPQPTSGETVHLKVGDIFEIMPVHSIDNASYTWILTQDRTFLEASRAPSYRKRLIQPGTYTLYAEVDSADGTQRISRTITLDYAARQPDESANTQTAAGSGILVRTDPASDANGKTILSSGTQLLRLVPVNPDIVPLALDVDLSRDADGDGIPTNDIQGNETFFHSDATPLYLWITDDPLTTHSVSVTAAVQGGAKTQRIDILNEDIGRAQGVVKSPVQIKAEKTGDRTYSFSAVFDNPSAAAGQLLYQWQFGDGQQSLVTKSDHTYAADGSYQVSLLVRNLRDGSDVASTSLMLNVSPEGAASASSQLSSAISSAPVVSGGGATSSFSIWSILLLALLFIACMAIGVGIIFLIGKLRKGKTSLADRLESMEQTLVKSPVQDVAPLKIAPPAAVVTTTKEPPAEIAEREKEQDVARPAPEPTVKPEVTPAWLNPSATMKPGVMPAPAAAPVAAPVQTPKQATPTPPPAPQVPKPATPAPSPASGPTTPTQAPSWLQPARAGDGQPTTPVAPKPPVPAAAPQPQKPVDTPAPQAPKPAPAPAPVVTPKPAPSAPSATPAWLQTPAPATTPKPAAPSAPAPTPAVPQIPKPTEQPAAPKPAPAPVTPTPVVAAQPPMPKADAPVMPPKPAMPAPQPQMQKPADGPSTPIVSPQAPTPKPFTPAPVVQTPMQKPVENPAPAAQMPKPMQASASAPAVPVVPQAPKPAPAPVPATPVQPAVPPTPVQPQPIASDKPVQMDIPPASDDQIAIIRADSLNQPDGQNG